MKITKSRLKQIIKEEMSGLIEMYDRDLFGDEDREPEPPEENAPPHDMAKREELIGYLMEDGIDVNMNSHLSNEQLDAILKISRNEPGAGMGGMSRNEYMWDKTAKAFPEEYEGQENPFKVPTASSESSWALKRKLDLGR